MTTTRRVTAALAWMAVTAGAVAGCGSSGSTPTEALVPSTEAPAVSTAPPTTLAAGGKPSSTPLLDKDARTVLDQVLVYPSATPAQVSSSIITFPPGATTGLHRHDAPMYAYVLEGTVTVTYEGGVVKAYTAGSAIMEAVGTAHDGANLTDQPARLLVVNIGAEGVANSVTL